MNGIKLQVTLKAGSYLHTIFLPLAAGVRAAHSRELMELGARAGSLESVVERVIRDGLRDISVVAPAASLEGTESLDAGAAADDALGEYFG